MTKTTIKEQYFEWMVRKVKGQSRRRVLEVLDNIAFTYLMPRDGNRYEDGVSLRYRFGKEMRIPEAVIANELDHASCTVLEMMIALAIRCEEEYMYVPTSGDRSYVWFDDMLKSMDLYQMTDNHFVQPYVVDHVFTMMNRRYDQNGHGGLFTVGRPGVDMRNEEIWNQAMWHISSQYHFT